MDGMEMILGGHDFGSNGCYCQELIEDMALRPVC